MTKRKRVDQVLRLRFVIRHSSFVICPVIRHSRHPRATSAYCFFFFFSIFASFFSFGVSKGAFFFSFLASFDFMSAGLVRVWKMGNPIRLAYVMIPCQAAP